MIALMIQFRAEPWPGLLKHSANENHYQNNKYCQKACVKSPWQSWSGVSEEWESHYPRHCSHQMDTCCCSLGQVWARPEELAELPLPLRQLGMDALCADGVCPVHDATPSYAISRVRLRHDKFFCILLELETRDKKQTGMMGTPCRRSRRCQGRRPCQRCPPRGHGRPRWWPGRAPSPLCPCPGASVADISCRKLSC